VRLACQTFIHCNPVKLHRIIRDEKDMKIYTQDKNSNNQVGEEREMALFFLDIRNFTPFMETYPAFDVIHVLRRMFEVFRKAIENHGGRIIETAGDGLYAVFGFDTTIREAVNNSIKAGQVLLDELNIFNETYLAKNFYHQFEVGIGLHAGRVITGNIGLGVNNNITVMGLPVNIASRLQAATKKLNNSFVISDVVYKMMDEKQEIKSATINLKGIKKAFKVYMIGQGYKHHLQFEGIS
jgi:adenylate cyclase